MQLFAFHPNGHGPLSFFVVAATESEARSAVNAEIERRLALPPGNGERITAYEFCGWGTDGYTLTVAAPGVVLCNEND